MFLVFYFIFIQIQCFPDNEAWEEITLTATRLSDTAIFKISSKGFLYELFSDENAVIMPNNTAVPVFLGFLITIPPPFQGFLLESEFLESNHIEMKYVTIKYSPFCHMWIKNTGNDVFAIKKGDFLGELVLTPRVFLTPRFFVEI